MTALDLIAAGGRFVRRDTLEVVFAAPPWARDLTAIADAEIARRVPRMREWRPEHADAGVCGHCGDALKPFVAGNCELCAAARWIALRTGGIRS